MALNFANAPWNGSLFGCHCRVRIQVGMQNYSSEDYAPSSSKILKRKTLIEKFLKLTCDVANGGIVESGGGGDFVGSKSGFSEKFLEVYFRNVARFKINNDYSPDDGINQARATALMLKTLKSYSWDDMFYRVSERIHENIMEELHCEMAIQLVIGLLHIRPEAVLDDLSRDFYIRFSGQSYMSDEWACWSMANYMHAFGAPMKMED